MKGMGRIQFSDLFTELSVPPQAAGVVGHKPNAYFLCGQVISGCLAGTVHVSNYNAGVLRQTRGERKSPVDSKGKSFSLDLDGTF